MNIPTIPTRQATPADEAESNVTTACGNRCSSEIPNINPPTKLISSCVRRWVMRISEGRWPPAADAKTMTKQYKAKSVSSVIQTTFPRISGTEKANRKLLQFDCI